MDSINPLSINDCNYLLMDSHQWLIMVNIVKFIDNNYDTNPVNNGE